jgi:deoxyribodipyrimidine photo-lyase
LAKLPNEFIHKPFEATEEMLSEANLVLGESYPNPIVKHASARDAALAGLEKVRTAKLSSPR